MWLISVVVLSVVGYFVSGRKLPVEVVDNLNHVVSEDLAPSERLVALFFVVGAVVGITPIRIGLRYLSTVVHELGHAFVAGTLADVLRASQFLSILLALQRMKSHPIGVDFVPQSFLSRAIQLQL